MNPFFASLGIGYQHPLTDEYVLTHREILNRSETARICWCWAGTC